MPCSVPIVIVESCRRPCVQYTIVTVLVFVEDFRATADPSAVSAGVWIAQFESGGAMRALVEEY